MYIMITMLLLCVIYIAFIGMGLPSSLFGAAFPAIQSDFAISDVSANYVTVLISGFTVIAVMLGARLVKRFGTFRIVSVCTMLAVIAFIFIMSIPLWKKGSGKSQNDYNDSAESENLSYISMVKNPAIRLAWLMCIAANIMEGVIGTWGSKFLIDALSLDEASAAGLITMFFIGIAAGRFLSGILSTKLSAWSVIKIATVVMFIGAGLMFVPVSAVAAFGILLVGLGIGPIYPNILYLTPTHFGQKHSASILGSQTAAAYSGFLIGPPMFSLFVTLINASVLPAFILAVGVILVIAAICFLRKIKKH